MARQVGAACEIDGNTAAGIHRQFAGGGSTEKGGVHQYRVDDDRLAPIVGGELKADVGQRPPPSVAAQCDRVAAVDLGSAASVLLVHDRLSLAYGAPAHRHHEVALRVDRERVRAFDVQGNRPRVRTCMHDEVVFELLLIPVVDEVDTGIDVVVGHFRKGRNPGPPLLAIRSTQVVDLARQLVVSFGTSRSVAADRCQPQHGA